MPSVAQVALTADACAGRNFEAIRLLRQWHPEQPDQSDPAGNGFAPLRAPAVGVLHDPFSAPVSAQTLRKHPLAYLFKQSSRTREPRECMAHLHRVDFGARSDLSPCSAVGGRISSNFRIH